jgi:hypothetical protein
LDGRRATHVELGAAERAADLVRQPVCESEERAGERGLGTIRADRGPGPERPGIHISCDFGASRPEAEREDRSQGCARHERPGRERQQEGPSAGGTDVAEPRLQTESGERDQETSTSDRVDVGHGLAVDVSERSDRSQGDESDDKEGNRLPDTAPGRLRRDHASVLTATPGPGNQEQERRQEHRAQQLDYNRYIAADAVVSRARGDRLRSVSDRRSGPQTEGQYVEIERMANQGKDEDGERSEERDRRYRKAHLAIVRLHHGRRGGDRRRAAYGTADPDQNRKPAVGAKASRQHDGKPACQRHRHHDQPDGLGADSCDRVQVEAKTEQDDPEAQHVLDRDLGSAMRLASDNPEIGEDESDEHRQRHLEPDREGVGERQLRDQVGGEADCGGQRKSGWDLAQRAQESFVEPLRGHRADGRSGGRQVSGRVGQVWSPHSVLRLCAQRPSRATPRSVQWVHPIDA